MPLEQSSKRWPEITYNGFARGGPAAPTRAPAYARVLQGRIRWAPILAGGAAALAAAAFAALPVLGRKETEAPPAPPAAIAPAPALAEPETPLPTPIVPAAPQVAEAAPSIPADGVRAERRRPVPAARRGPAAASPRAESAATASANLREAYAPQSTLSAQAAAIERPFSQLR